MATKYADFDLLTGLDDGSSTANAWQSSASMAAAVAATDTVLIKDSTDTLAAGVTFSTGGSKGSEIILRGVNSSWVADGTRPIVDGNSAVTTCWTINGGSYQVENMEFINSNGDAVFVSSVDNAFKNIRVNNAGGDGMQINGNDNVVGECEISNTGSRGAILTSRCNIFRTFIFGTGSDGVNSPAGMSSSIVHDTAGTAGIVCSNGHIINNIIDDAAIGIFTTGDGTIVKDNRITNTTDNGVQCSNFACYGNNYFNSIGGSDYSIASGLEYSDSNLSSETTGTGYNNVGADDFTLDASTDTGVGLELPIGKVGTINDGYFTQGIPPIYATSGSESFSNTTIMIGKIDSVVDVGFSKPVLTRIIDKLIDLIADMNPENGYAFDYGSIDEYDPDSRTYPAVFLETLEEDGEDEDSNVIDRYPVVTPLNIKVIISNTTTIDQALQNVIADFGKVFADNLATFQTEGLILVDYINRTWNYTSVDAYPAETTMTFNLKYRRQKTSPYRT